MSSYNENLHNTVVAVAETQRLELKKLEAQQEAAMFGLYYSEAGAVTARQQLNTATNVFNAKDIITTKANNCNNTCIDLLSAATQASQVMQQARTNNAMAAANVQVAANSVVKLATSICSIYAIIRAAEYDTQIAGLGNEVKELVETTAYIAEEASLMAMEASMATAEIAAATLEDQSKDTAQMMTHFLDTLTLERNVTFSELTEKNNNSVVALNASAKADGAFTCSFADHIATENAWKNMNNLLNLGLEVKDITDKDLTVEFNLLQPPFPGITPFIQAYYIIIVKDVACNTFSLSQAEALLRGTGKKDTTVQCIPVPFNTASPVTKKITLPDTAIDIDGKQSMLTVLDSDGELLQAGTDYVVLLLAVYSEEYKKRINQFDNLLSAPSTSFMLKKKISAVGHATIQLKEKEISFRTDQDTSAEKTEHRLMLLPIELADGGNASLVPGEDFIFNTQIAEQVKAGNYIIARKDTAANNYKVTIKESTSDIFGNLLIEGISYQVVVLSCILSPGDEVTVSALSNRQESPVYVHRKNIAG